MGRRRRCGRITCGITPYHHHSPSTTARIHCVALQREGPIIDPVGCCCCCGGCSSIRRSPLLLSAEHPPTTRFSSFFSSRCCENTVAESFHSSLIIIINSSFAVLLLFLDSLLLLLLLLLFLFHCGDSARHRHHILRQLCVPQRKRPLQLLHGDLARHVQGRHGGHLRRAQRKRLGSK